MLVFEQMKGTMIAPNKFFSVRDPFECAVSSYSPKTKEKPERHQVDSRSSSFIEHTSRYAV